MQNRSINIYYSDTVVTGDDMLHVSRSGGWNKVEVYPVDHDGEAIKISASFTFFAKQHSKDSFSEVDDGEKEVTTKSPALGGAAVAAFQAPLFIDQGLLPADGTFLSLGLCFVGQVFLQCPLHTVLPGVDGLTIELQSRYQLNHLVDGHAVPQHPGDQLRVVPEFRIEFFVKSLNRDFVTPTVPELKIVMLPSIAVIRFDNLSGSHILRNHDAIVLIVDTGKYFVGPAVEQPDESDPSLFVVLKLDHIRIQLNRTGSDNGRHFKAIILFFILTSKLF